MSALFQPFPMLAGRAAQVWRHQAAYRRPRHFHAEPELNIVVRGTAVLGVGEREITLNSRDLLVFEAGQDHALLEASEDLELFVMALRPALAERVHGDRPLLFKEKIALGAAEFESVAEQALALGGVRDACAVETIVGDIFSALARRPRGARVSSRRAVHELREDPASSAARLGRISSTGASRLSREFRSDLGVTLVEYRARLRLMRFVQYVDSGMPLSQAALQADFGSYAQCHRVFQRVFSCSPRAYFSGKRSGIDALFEPLVSL